MVVCTGLPIGAKIEWQIVCGSKEYLQSMDLEQESFDFEGILLSFRIIYFIKIHVSLKI